MRRRYLPLSVRDGMKTLVTQVSVVRGDSEMTPEPTTTDHPSGTPSEGSGPDPATGYTIIEAADLHDAVVKAKGCPGLSSGGSVKLYEARQMG